MREVRVAAFAALVVATVAAFFVTQHLKVSNPLINGSPRPDPAAINPIAGRRCVDVAGDRVSFRRTRVSFFLQSRSDTVGVYVIDADGDQVATIASGRTMRLGERSLFTWNGREGDHSDGSFAPDGTYYFRVALQRAGRTFTLPAPVRIITTAPVPAITGVQAAGAAASAASGPVLIAAPGQPVTIHYRPGAYRTAFINIYRTDVSGRPVIVKTFRVGSRRGVAVWDGLIHQRPAPAGTYLVGMAVTDAACNVGTFPAVNPPAPGSTPHSGVTVRYLAAQPPLTPVAAGALTDVLVDSANEPYTWALRRTGSAKVLAQSPTGRHAVRSAAARCA